MTQEFVPYEQALALKELGFDEMCMGKFIPYFSESGWLLEINERLQYSTNSLLGQGFSAPLYQQAFRWFRERYKLEGITQCAEERVWYKFGIYQLYGDCKIMISAKLEFKTYEEAELECLKKLIQIVKENK